MSKIIQKKQIGFETLYLGKSHIFAGRLVFMMLTFDFRYALVLEDKASKKAADSSKPETEQVEPPKAEPVRYIT